MAAGREVLERVAGFWRLKMHQVFYVASRQQDIDIRVHKIKTFLVKVRGNNKEQ